MNVILASEWLKTRRTPIRWLTIALPIIISALIIWYFSRLHLTSNLQLKIFQTFFEIWTSLIIPSGVGLISGLLIHQEEMAGNFHGFLGSPISRASIYLGKLLMLILLSSMGIFLAILLLLFGLKYVLFPGISISWQIFFLGAIMAQIGTLPLLAFHLFISLAYGMGSSIGIGGVGILLAALIGGTSLGNTIWPYVPWAWPVRLAQFPGIFFPGQLIPSSITPSRLFWNLTLPGLIPAMGLAMILIIGGLIWFQRWEGRKYEQ